MQIMLIIGGKYFWISIYNLLEITNYHEMVYINSLLPDQDSRHPQRVLSTSMIMFHLPHAQFISYSYSYAHSLVSIYIKQILRIEATCANM